MVSLTSALHFFTHGHVAPQDSPPSLPLALLPQACQGGRLHSWLCVISHLPLPQGSGKVPPPDPLRTEDMVQFLQWLLLGVAADPLCVLVCGGDGVNAESLLGVGVCVTWSCLYVGLCELYVMYMQHKYHHVFIYVT